MLKYKFFRWQNSKFCQHSSNTLLWHVWVLMKFCWLWHYQPKMVFWKLIMCWKIMPRLCIWNISMYLFRRILFFFLGCYLTSSKNKLFFLSYLFFLLPQSCIPRWRHNTCICVHPRLTHNPLPSPRLWATLSSNDTPSDGVWSETVWHVCRWWRKWVSQEIVSEFRFLRHSHMITTIQLDFEVFCRFHDS